MTRLLALLAVVATALLALALPALADTDVPPTSTTAPVVTTSPMPTSSAAPTTAPPLVSASVCAALTVKGVKLLGTQAPISLLLTNLLGSVPANATPASLSQARLRLGCDGDPAGGSDTAVAAAVCVFLDPSVIIATAGGLGLDAGQTATFNAIKPTLGTLVSVSRLSLCPGDGTVKPTATATATGTGTATPTSTVKPSGSADPTSTTAPPVTPLPTYIPIPPSDFPSGAPETGGE